MATTVQMKLLRVSLTHHHYPLIYVEGNGSQWMQDLGSLYTNGFSLPAVVSRAFQVLSDSEKKAKFDRFGGDPDNRFGSSGSAGPSASSPFSGFARSPGGARGPMFEDEISPEELFNRFFAGSMGPGSFGEFPTKTTILIIFILI